MSRGLGDVYKRQDQKIDEVHELDVDGKTYYLWIINDLKTRNKASEVRIESVDKTTQNR